MRTAATPSLFDSPAQGQSLVGILQRNKAGDKAQLRFAQLVGKIERKRAQLKKWQAYRDRFTQRIAGEYEPVRVQVLSCQRQMALLLDTLLTQPAPGRKLRRPERAKLRELLAQLLEALEPAGDDETFKALRQRHRDPEQEETDELDMELTQTMLKDVLGLDIGDDHGATSTEELMDYVQHKMRERADEQARRAEQIRRNHQRNPSGAAGGKASAAQAQRAQAAKEVSQSLREVFRKLVSALHPDREPDAAERQRKNELMQRVNLAYEANDLLTLLSLQLEIEQIDAAHLASLTPQRLAHYNQILNEQLMELDAELRRFIHPFVAMLNAGFGKRPTIAEVDGELSRDIAQMRAMVRQLKADIEAFGDPHRLHRRLKDYLQEDEELGDFDELADFVDLMDSVEPPRRRRRRSRR